MTERVGIDCEMSRNTGTIALPVFVPVENIRDVTKSQEWDKAEFKTRKRKHKRFRKTLLERALEFQMEHNPDNVDDNANFVAFRDAFEDPAGSLILAVLDGPSDEPGSQGLHGHFIVTKFERSEELEGAVLYDVNLDLAVADEEPEWLETV